ncbi:NAD(P)-dependent oxidoreductase [Nonomuraea sediminis]|uniref:NAD(P)-dependent oxidoreductase n=1 Tax=Nonomuraea sediminis TaxID=2835864 RepID=UPI001BDD1CF3|nr:NAD(P)-dependent oxidoreductase [Nonomuraea sediminis]
MNIAFIGLGHMGGPMARNLLKAGYFLTVHDLRREAAAEHLDLGARWADSVTEAVADADVLITMLPGPKQVTAVMSQVTLKPGATWIDMSTSTPEAARVFTVDRLDAPVSGMAKGAQNGTLQIFVGGPEPLFERFLPIFRAMGSTILHVGPHGAGYTVKLMINLLWFAHLVATTEVLTMGAKAGVDLGVLRDSLIASPANSTFLERDVLSVLRDGDYDESFALALACKDLGLAVDLGRDVGVPVELSALVEQIYRRGRARFGDLAGEMAPMRLYEEVAGLDLRIGDAA